MSESLEDFIARVEAAHFRTQDDTGANECALLIWNMVREFADKPRLRRRDLRSYCEPCKTYHYAEQHVVTRQ